MIGEPLGQGCVSLVTRDVMDEDSDAARRRRRLLL
jgi:hypothetical protein